MKMKFFGILCLLLCQSLAQATEPAPIDRLFPGKFPLGSGELNSFMFKLYDIALWAENKSCAETFSCNMALQTVQNWGAGREKLVSKTLEKIEKVHPKLDQATLEKYKGYLNSVYPEKLEAEDTIQILLEYGKKTPHIKFYHRSKKEGKYILKGDIEDQKFSLCFFGIWLHPKTSYQKLRSTLLGKDKP